MTRVVLLGCALALLVALTAGCGSSQNIPSSSTPGSTATPVTVASGAALTGEAASVATGDIPDNQVFLLFRDATVGFSMKYPEGWAQRGAGSSVTFQDKNNIVHVGVRAGAQPTTAAVTAELAQLKRVTPSLSAGVARAVRIAAGVAVKVTYTTTSAADPVTGKTVALVVDRYYIGGAGRVAVLDLGTPRGVDNVDAYRLMVASFRWR